MPLLLGERRTPKPRSVSAYMGLLQESTRSRANLRRGPVRQRAFIEHIGHGEHGDIATGQGQPVETIGVCAGVGNTGSGRPAGAGLQRRWEAGDTALLLDVEEPTQTPGSGLWAACMEDGIGRIAAEGAVTAASTAGQRVGY